MVSGGESNNNGWDIHWSNTFGKDGELYSLLDLMNYQKKITSPIWLKLVCKLNQIEGLLQLIMISLLRQFRYERCCQFSIFNRYRKMSWYQNKLCVCSYQLELYVTLSDEILNFFTRLVFVGESCFWLF